MPVDGGDISAAVLAALLADAGAGGVATLTAGRVYGGQAPQGPLEATVEVTVITDVPDRFFGKLQDFDVHFDVDIWTSRLEGMEVARTIARAVTLLLDEEPLTVTGASSCETRVLDRGEPTPDEDSYHVTQRWHAYGTIT